MMHNRISYLITVAVAALPFLVSCGGSSGKLLPNVSGKAGEVLVVAEKSDWDGIVGTVLRDSLMADCPFLPQHEPLYNVTSVPPSAFSQMFQVHRNIIMVNVNPQAVPGMVCKYDKWASPQIAISVSAATPEAVADTLRKRMHTIVNALETIERDRIISNTRKYCEAKLTTAVKDFAGASMVFPSGYSLKKVTEDFMWISYETTYVQQGVFIYKYPARRSASELSCEALVARRNAVLKVEVPGMLDGSYMTTSPAIAPAVNYASYRGLKFARLRGLWDVHGDFMGGPFISHSMYTPDGSQIVCAEAYVYAPKFDKRLYLRQVEALLYSFSWEKEK